MSAPYTLSIIACGILIGVLATVTGIDAVIAYQIERFLLWVGFIRLRPDGSIRWPFSAPPSHVFRSWRSFYHWCRWIGPFYVFRNKPHVIKWEKGRLLPRRWGFGVFGFEFGDRGGV